MRAMGRSRRYRSPRSIPKGDRRFRSERDAIELAAAPTAVGLVAPGSDRPSVGLATRRRCAAGCPEGAGAEHLVPPADGRGRALRFLDDRALVPEGAQAPGSGGTAHGPGPRRRRSAARHQRRAGRGDPGPVRPIAQVDGSAPLCEPEGRSGRPFRAVLPDGTSLLCRARLAPRGGRSSQAAGRNQAERPQRDPQLRGHPRRLDVPPRRPHLLDPRAAGLGAMVPTARDLRDRRSLAPDRAPAVVRQPREHRMPGALLQPGRAASGSAAAAAQRQWLGDDRRRVRARTRSAGHRLPPHPAGKGLAERQAGKTLAARGRAPDCDARGAAGSIARATEPGHLRLDGVRVPDDSAPRVERRNAHGALHQRRLGAARIARLRGSAPGVSHRGHPPAAPERRHRLARRPPLRGPPSLRPPARAAPALRPLGPHPGRPGRCPRRHDPGHHPPPRQGPPCRWAAPSPRADRSVRCRRTAVTGRPAAGAAAAQAAGAVRRHRTAGGHDPPRTTEPQGIPMTRALLAPYGLKFNPFAIELPAEALYQSPRIVDFFWRIENVLVREGGFTMITGDPGTGKSVVLHTHAEQPERQSDLTVGVINHPQSNLADFYRELGEVFGVALRPSNRWAGFKVLRERWHAHLEATRRRTIILIDEAQEMGSKTLLELRMLASTRFDSLPLLAVVLAGDARLCEALAKDDLLPLG